jgi:uncharacterized protein
VTEEIVRTLGLEPHPEGGAFTETWRGGESSRPGRAAGSAILFLLRAGEVSRWHRVDAAEIWHFHAGSPLELRIEAPGEPAVGHVLGIDVERRQRPQIVVPEGAWQSARSLGEWTLVGCTVSPAFDWDGFELAPDDWEPGRAPSS